MHSLEFAAIIFMSLSSLPNYLRAERKRLALSQSDVASLLGVQSSAKVSRLELSVRMPDLETAFACEVIFQKPARELFGGIYERIEAEVASRAKSLAKQGDSRNDEVTVGKFEVFVRIAAARSVNHENP